MKTNAILAIMALGAVTGAAADNNIQKRSFKVERVANAAFSGHNGPRSLLKAYRKYGMSVPAPLVEAARRGGRGRPHHHRPPTNGTSGTNNNDAGSRPATNSTTSASSGLVSATPEANDVEYLAPVDIGGQTVNLDFDSGSSDLWVFSTQMPASQQQGHAAFDPSKSATFEEIKDATFQVSYGDGSGAEGTVGTDTVTIGGVSFARQAVELATAVSDEFVADTNTDGLLGLAFSSLNTVQPQQQKTFFDNVAGQLAEPVFTADLRPDAVGAYEFGRIDASKFSGAMAWIPVNTTQGFWQFSSETFTVGDGGEVQQGTSGAQAIADTGTTLMLVDPGLAEAYYAQVEGAAESQEAGGVVVPCDAALPDLTVDIGGVYQARVKGTDIMFAEVGDGSELLSWEWMDLGIRKRILTCDTVCFGGIQPSPTSFFIYGDIFFKSQFVAFNSGNSSLGMADHV
jgi:hypothetical protein